MHLARRTRPSPDPVPASLVGQVAAALAAVDTAREALRDTLHSSPSLAERRAAHAELTAAFASADRLLRRAAELTRPTSYRQWRAWRHRLSQLDLARQAHLFAQADDLGCLGVGSVRAVDTGMTGPNIGELQHGHSQAPGAPAGYGLDLDAALTVPAWPATAAAAVPHETVPTLTDRRPAGWWPDAA